MTSEQAVRALAERSICPILPPGSLGVVAARAGVGKSSCLVRISLEELARGGHALHVALDNPVAHVRVSYDAVLDVLQKHDEITISAADRLELERRRHIHSYLGGTFSADKLAEALGFLAEHVDFRPSAIVVDGFQFGRAGEEELRGLSRIASEADASLWMSALVHREDPDDAATGLPAVLAPFAEHFGTVLSLEPRGDEVHLYSLREGARASRRRLPVRLDPATLLLVRDSI